MSQNAAGWRKPHSFLSRFPHKSSERESINMPALDSKTAYGCRTRSVDDSKHGSGELFSKGGTTFDSIWAEAFRHYENSTGRQICDQDRLRDLQSPESLLAELESHQCKFESWRGKGAKLRSALSLMLKPVNQLGEVAKSALSLTPFAPTAIIFGASTFLIEAANGVSEKYDWIAQLFEKLGEFMVRLQDYGEEDMAEHLQPIITAILICLLEIIGLSEGAVNDGRWKKYLATVFLGRDDRIKESFDRLARLLEGEERLVRAISYATNQRVDKRTKRIQKTTEETGRDVKEIATSLNDAQLDNKKKEEDEQIKAMLCPQAENKSQAIYGEYASQLLEGSGDWLTSEHHYSNWINGDYPLLWVSGGPGTGKSYLSTITIERLKARYPQDASYPGGKSVAYFFIKEDDQELRDLNAILRRIAHQITLVDSAFRKHVLQTCPNVEKIHSAKATWQTLFMDFFGSNRFMDNSAFVVIDGVDEAMQQSLEQLFQVLEDLIPNPSFPRKPRLMIAIFGRREVTAHTSYKLLRSLPEIEIGHNNLKDITKYIKKHVGDVLIVRQARKMVSDKYATQLKRGIIHRVLDKADGMFFKVVLIMKEIRDKESKSKVFEAIQEAPPLLNTMIQRIFERLSRDPNVNKDYLKEILLWAAFAKRPVTMGELYVICKLRTGIANETLENRLRNKFASIFKIAGPPQPEDPEMVADDSWNSDEDFVDDDVDFSESDFSITAPDESENVLEIGSQMNVETVTRYQKTVGQFAHTSIRDFLVKSDMFILERIGINVIPGTADFHLFLMCLEALTSDGALANTDAKVECLTLEDYSVEFFLDHLMAFDCTGLGQAACQSLIKALYTLFHDTARLESLLEIVEKKNLGQKYVELIFWEDKLFTKLRQIPTIPTEQCTLDSKELAWFRDTTQSSDNLFQPLCAATFRIWFKDPETLCTWNRARFVISILHSSFAVKNDGKGLKDQRPTTCHANFSKISEERLLELANLSSFAHDQIWHARLAKTLFHAKHIDAAIMQSLKAIELDEKCWQARKVLALCFEDYEDLETAVKWQRSAYDMLASSELSEDPASLELLQETGRNMVRLLINHARYDEATQLALELHRKNLNDDRSTKALFNALWASKSYLLMLDFAQELHSQEAKTRDMTCLEELLLTNSMIFGPMLRTGDAMDWFVPIVERFVQWCWEQQRYIPHMNLTLLKYRFFNRVHSPEEVWESILQASAPEDDQTASTFKNVQEFIIRQLCPIYSERAALAQAAQEDYIVWANKLRALVVDKQQSYKGREVHKAELPAMVYGHWLRKFEKADATVWMPCFRPSMISALDMLDDDLPSNDQSAFSRVGVYLLLAGDVVNAKAALVVTMRGLELIGLQPPRTRQWRAEHNLRIIWNCDGLCRTHKSRYRELHFCADCFDTCFCEECIVLLKDGRLPLRRCNPAHSFVQIYPISDEARDVAARYVEPDMKLEIQTQWLEDMRRKWKSDESK